MEILVVAAVVGGAVLYLGWKTWGMLKPGPKGGCNCGSPKSSCSGCPLVKP